MNTEPEFDDPSIGSYDPIPSSTDGMPDGDDPEIGEGGAPTSQLPDPTSETYEDLNHAFHVFNTELFGGELQPCLITLRANGSYAGYFAPNRFVHPDGRVSHEIALNLESFASYTVEYALSVLVHEQVHLLQHQRRTYSRRGYHNADFAAQMEKVGLITSTTAAPGGKRTGDKASHYIAPGGRFIAVCAALVDAGFRARWVDRVVKKRLYEWKPGDPERTERGKAAQQSDPAQLPPPDPRPAREGGESSPLAKDIAEYVPPEKARSLASKSKFVCPGCQAAAWGKPALKLICGTCQQPLVRTGVTPPIAN